MKVVAAVMFLAAAEAITPLTSVLNMLEAMRTKGEKEKHEENARFVAVDQWCRDTIQSRQRAIKDANMLITSLTASIESDNSSAENLASEIAALTRDIGLWENDQKVSSG